MKRKSQKNHRNYSELVTELFQISQEMCAF